MRSSRTECCVGFVFSSFVAPMYGSNVTWIESVSCVSSGVAHLADRLEERLPLHVTDGAADLDEHDLGAVERLPSAADARA